MIITLYVYLAVRWLKNTSYRNPFTGYIFSRQPKKESGKRVKEKHVQIKKFKLV